jgi:hypothetical protein
VPLLQRVGEYVHVGLEGDTAVWVASIADVVDGPDDDVVYYVGVAIDVVDGSLVFEDGTVLKVSSSLDLPVPPAGGVRLAVTIDTDERVVVAVESSG